MDVAPALLAGLDQHLAHEAHVGGQFLFIGEDVAHREVPKAAVRFFLGGHKIGVSFQHVSFPFSSMAFMFFTRPSVSYSFLWNR
jgi:hypothetical protein